MANIKKIRLSDGSVYSIFDEGALRLNENNQLVTGNIIVDDLIINQGLYITEIDDCQLNSIDNVLTAIQNEDGSWTIQKRSTDMLLKDIGGTSTSINNEVLTLKIGK